MSERTRQGDEGKGGAVPINEIGTTLGRARCAQPTQVSRMRQSMARHGQLTALLLVKKEGKLELVDGFKRLVAAQQMGWNDLRVTVRELDERAAWAAMLTLNRAAGLSVLEEALILRELFASGLCQVEIGQLLGRHKSWVSRRIGLVERLHPDLLEWVKTGMLSAGMARRLIVLPAGNQLEVAAAVNQAGLKVEQAELLVSLWRKASDPEVRRFLLKEPTRALENAQPEQIKAVIDPRLSPRGKALAQSLPLLRAVARRVSEALYPTPPDRADLSILLGQMSKTAAVLPELDKALGFASKCARSSEPSAPSDSPTFDVSFQKGTAFEARLESSAST